MQMTITRYLVAMIWLMSISTGLVEAEPLPTKPGSDRMTITYTKNLEQEHHILAIESQFSPYFKKLICETDVLQHLQLLLRSPRIIMWHDIIANLPPNYQLPFTATEFDSAIRNGHMDNQKLSQDIINNAMEACPEHLAALQPPVANPSEALKDFLNIMFDRLQQRSEMELKVQERQSHMRKMIDRFYRLPDLLGIARAKNTQDIYADQKSQAAQRDKSKTPYRLSMPERHLTTCKSGKHKLATIRYTLINPARLERIELTEADIHEVLEHDGELPLHVVEFLKTLSESDLLTTHTEAQPPLTLNLKVSHDPARGILLDIVAANTSHSLYKLCLTQPNTQLRSNQEIEVELSCHERGQGTYLAPGAEHTHSFWLKFGNALPLLEIGKYTLILSIRGDVDNIRAKIIQPFAIMQRGSGINEQERAVELARIFLRRDNTIITFQGMPPPPEGDDKRTRVDLEHWTLVSTSTHWEISFSNNGPEMWGSTSVSVAKTAVHTSNTKRILNRPC